MKNYVLLPLVAILTFGCESSDRDPKVDQAKICVATTDEQALACTEGQLFMARITQPDLTARAYNILNSVALYCNTNYPIFENPAGVVCIMTHARISALTGIQRDSKAPGKFPSSHEK